MRLREIVEGLLFLAQPDGPGLVLCAVDLGEWLPNHLARWSDHARATDLRLELDDGPLGVRVHPAMLAQLVDNLLDNACKYSPAGAPIIVKGSRGEGIVTLIVEDRGGMLTPDDAAHIFDPFFRAERARTAGIAGIGLGLAVARRIALALHGTLDLEINPDRSACFKLRLPDRTTDPAPRTGPGSLHRARV